MGEFALAVFGKYTLPHQSSEVLCDQERRERACYKHGLWNQAACHAILGPPLPACVTGQVHLLCCCLSFLLCKMGITAVPTSWGSCEDQVS